MNPVTFFKIGLPRPMQEKGLWICILFFCVMAFPLPSRASTALIPLPQEITKKTPVISVTINKGWQLAWDASVDLDGRVEFILQELADDLSQRGIYVSLKNISEIKSFERTIVIGNPFESPVVAKLFGQVGVSMDLVPNPDKDARFREGYLIDVSKRPSLIMIAAARAEGLHFGSRTLLQMVDSEKRVEGVRIVDYPDALWRGIYLNFKHTKCFAQKEPNTVHVTTSQCIVDTVKKYADLKLNRIVFRGHLFHRLNTGNFKMLQYLFEECRKRFIEPIPSIESKLENLPPFGRDQPTFIENIEGVYIQNAEFIVGKDGILQPTVKIENILKNGSFEVDSDSNRFPDHWNTGLSIINNYWRKVDKSIDNGTHSGGHAVGVRSEMAPPWKTTNLLSKSGILDSRIQQDVPVNPNGYLMLGFWGRSEKHTSRIKVYILQYNDQDSLIEGRNFQHMFMLGKNWRKRYLPIFTDSESHHVRLIFESVKGKSKGDVFLDDVEMVRMDGSLINVLDTLESDIIITDTKNGKNLSRNKEFRLKKSKNYISPQQVIAGLSHTQIEILPDAEIEPGKKLKVSYDSLIFNPRDKHSKRCPSAVGTYNEYKTLFENLLQLSPNYININMDEHRGGYNRDSRCLKRGLSNAEIFADFITKLNMILHDKGKVEVLPNKFLQGLGRPDVKMMLWDDMVNRRHNGGRTRGKNYQLRYGGVTGETYLALPKSFLERRNHSSTKLRYSIPTDVILAVWWYRTTDEWEKLAESSNYYENRGFEYVVCPWFNSKNIRNWSKQINGRRSLGMMGTTFDNEMAGVSLVADYGWHNATNR